MGDSVMPVMLDFAPCDLPCTVEHSSAPDEVERVRECVTNSRVDWCLEFPASALSMAQIHWSHVTENHSVTPSMPCGHSARVCCV